MPKEKVQGALSLDPSVVNQVEVGWSRETEHVQIVTRTVNQMGGRLFDGEGIHYTDGMWIDLDRKGINDLIRHLRRARDQAFGRDE